MRVGILHERAFVLSVMSHKGARLFHEKWC